MSRDTLLTPTNPVTISQHPYTMGENAGSYFMRITDGNDYERISNFMRQVLRSHQDNTIDLLIGDDVSGRVPTLLTHYFLKMAQAGGHANTAPQTIFIPSGLTHRDDKLHHRQWNNNLLERTERIVQLTSPKRVAIITEIVASGSSIARLKAPFLEHRDIDVGHFNVGCGPLYLNNDLGDENSIRAATGVEKYLPAAASEKRPDFDAKKVADLRYFLKDYAAAVYADTFNDELPPATHSPKPPSTDTLFRT